MVRGFVALNALIWFPYGVYLFVAPGALESIAGVAATSATGLIEIRAMYGGLQMAIGALCGAAVRRGTLERPALATVAFLTAGLFTTRTVGALAAAELSSYTLGAMLFEIFLAVTASRLLAVDAAAGGN